jgi:hypothetical protein
VKRAPELVPLSREHHEALVLAGPACEPQRPGAAPAALREHVQFEERELFPLAQRELDLAPLTAGLSRPDRQPFQPRRNQARALARLSARL